MSATRAPPCYWSPISWKRAERLCDRLIIIDRGRIIADGSPQDLIDSVAGAQSLEDVLVAITAKPAAASTTGGA